MHLFLDNGDNKKVEELIEVCKSSSMVVGKKLRDAHYELGTIISEKVFESITSDHLTIIVLMRAGLSFAEGIADKIEELGKDISILFQNHSEDCFDEVEYIDGNEILIVDAVINSGKSNFELIPHLSKSKKLMFATTVIQHESVSKFEEYDLFAVRSSKNNYVGAKTKSVKNGKGPDTGDRLFNTIK